MEKIQSIRKSMDNQEERLQQHNLQDLRQQYEQVSMRETQLNKLLSEEKARNRIQQLEIDRRQQQLEDSTVMIRTLQEELESAYKKSRSLSMELQDSELKARNDSDILNLKTKITGLDARLKRKQIELDAANDANHSAKKNLDSLRREIDQLRAVLAAKEVEIAQIRRTMVLDEDSLCRDRNYLDRINQEIGSLKTENNAIKNRNDQLREDNQNLETKLTRSEEEKKTLQFKIDTMKGKITESEDSSSRYYSRLNDELEKTKQQKASLRCEHVQLKRKFDALEVENKSLQERLEAMKKPINDMEELNRKIGSIELEKNTLMKENDKLREQLENIDRDNKNKIDQMQMMVRENEESERAQVKLLNSELEMQHRKYDELKKDVINMDQQCEKLVTNLRTINAELKDTKNENNLLKKEIDELRKQFTDKFKVQSEFVALKDRNKQLEGKITYLENELKEAHNDHRQELAKLSDQFSRISASTNVKQCGKETDGNEQSGSRLNQSQQEPENRSLRRQQEQMKKEKANLENEMEELRKNEMEVINENTLLRQKFAECLKKAEDFRDQAKHLADDNTRLKEATEKMQEKLTLFEDQLFELRNEIEQKDKLVAYLQSIVQPKQTQKLPQRPRSSLLSSESEFISDIESEYKHCQQLEQRRNELKMDLDKKRKVLAQKNNGNESLPLLKDQHQLSLKTLQSGQHNAANSLKHSSTESTIATTTTRTPGKMRHDIPHRWKRQFMTIISECCQVCMEGFPYFRHVYRCRDCEMIAHPHCRQQVVNTCGLPSECANFYLDTHSTSSEQMTGWVKLLDIRAQNGKWQNAWASIEDHKLSFYESDQLALSDSAAPFIRIDLDQEQWRIYNQIAERPLDGVRGEDMSMLVELRLPNHSFLMLSPTVQAKQRWVQALQMATSRRIFIQRRPSSAIVGNTLMLALEAPQNLGINCTEILRSEWLLIGANEGLFATSIQQLRTPFQIAGIPKVFWMELLPEFDMLLAICGSNRRLMLVHLQQLNRAFKAEQQPSVNLTNISNIEQCHIAVVSKPEHNREKRFVYLATIDSIIILQYVIKLDVFSQIKQFRTEEPCMCICSTPLGFIYGADNFHFVRFDDGFSSKSQLMVDNCPYDIPVAAVEISDNEYLLAYHNFGLFVDIQGKRTRSRNVEWERVPLEFVYTSPYLYIVYCEFLEVVRIAPLIGPDSGTLTDDRNIFKCRSAHQTGYGLNESEVLFVVSGEDRVELHSFTRYDKNQQVVKSILKRKLQETNNLSGTKKKH